MKKNKKENQEESYDLVNDRPAGEEVKPKKWYITMFEPKDSKKDNTNTRILQMAFLFAGLFLALIGYLVKFQICDSAEVSTNAYNKRLSHYGEDILRGTIYSAN
jgi:hypothetical protein